MDTQLHLEILPQPDDFTCGPTCLHAVFHYFNDPVELHRVIRDTPRLKKGGTLAVWLGCQALRRGYRATIYTYNIKLFDPTWFEEPRPALADKLLAQVAVKKGQRLRAATQAVLEFITLGGDLRFQDLTSSLIRKYLNRGTPILTGLSSTYLYRSMREWGPQDDEDDIRGKPQGHFVVLCGYDKEKKTVLVADPLHPNPVSQSQYYEVDIGRLICAILLGVLTDDANLLILQPGKR